MVLSHRDSADFRRSLAPETALKVLHILNKFSFSFIFFFLPSWYFFSSFSQERLAMSLLLCRLVFFEKYRFLCFVTDGFGFFFTLNGFFSPVPLLHYFHKTLRVSECFRFLFGVKHFAISIVKHFSKSSD